MAGNVSPLNMPQRRRPSKVDFAQATNNWTAHSHDAALELASLPTRSWDFRLQNYISARINKYGHASFETGELRRLLGCPEGQSGERQLRRYLKAFKVDGIIAEESTSRCVIGNRQVFSQATNVYGCCREEKHDSFHDRCWVPGWGFESYPGEFADMLGDAAARAELINGATGLTLPGYRPFARQVEATAEKVTLKRKVTEEEIEIIRPVVRMSDYGNPLCPDCGVPMTESRDRATLTCLYGHSYPNPFAA